MYHSRFTQHGLSLQPAINAVKAGNRTQQDLECILHEKMGPVDVDHNAKRRMWPSFPSPLKSVTSVKLAKSAASTSKIRTDAGQGLGTEEVSELCTCKDCQKLLPPMLSESGSNELFTQLNEAWPYGLVSVGQEEPDGEYLETFDKHIDTSAPAVQINASNNDSDSASRSKQAEYPLKRVNPGWGNDWLVMDQILEGDEALRLMGARMSIKRQPWPRVDKTR
ncbi:hypothetical protein H2203_006926 [Taxawa tesnikishii (nom. ined.)]|nr:hypothetical protein H2203_006926 [Dothideales sp. JES 119]